MMIKSPSFVTKNPGTYVDGAMSCPLCGKFVHPGKEGAWVHIIQGEFGKIGEQDLPDPNGADQGMWPVGKACWKKNKKMFEEGGLYSEPSGTYGEVT